MLLVGTGRRPPASSECVPAGPVRRDEALAEVSGKEPAGVVRRVLLESAVPHRHRRGVLWGRQVAGGRLGQVVRGARPQGRSQGRRPALRGWTPCGLHHRPQGPHRPATVPPLRGRRPPPIPPPGPLRCRAPGGGGALGIGGVPRRPQCPSLEDVGGRFPIRRRGGCVHRVPRQVFQHRPNCVALVCTQEAFCGFRGPHSRRERYQPAGGALRGWVEGQVGQWDRVPR